MQVRSMLMVTCCLPLWISLAWGQGNADFSQKDYSQPKGVAGLPAEDKNFTYYSFPEMHKRAAGFLIWMDQGNQAADYVVRDAAEFRGYVLAHLEHAHADWRKKCNSPNTQESPNAIVQQVALAMVSYDKPEEAKGMGGIAVAGGMFLRCLSPRPENQKK